MSCHLVILYIVELTELHPSRPLATDWNVILWLIKKSIQLTPSHLSDDVSGSWFLNCFDLPHIYVHFMTLADLFPVPLVQFYVNAAGKD